MEQENIKKIKEALECMSGLCKDSISPICFDCKIDKKFDEESACKEALTLINELEKEKLTKFAERLKEEGFVIFMGDIIIRGSKVDEVLNEFLGDK